LFVFDDIEGVFCRSVMDKAALLMLSPFRLFKGMEEKCDLDFQFRLQSADRRRRLPDFQLVSETRTLPDEEPILVPALPPQT
jgi:hypothetical protein